MHVIIVMGVTGAGKTTIGELLARQLGWEFIDADGLHSVENRHKMSLGQPLTDEDRGPWLKSIRALIERLLVEDRRAVIACSALKQSYREMLMVDRRRVKLVYLKGTRELIAARIATRHGHFMDPRLLQSQFDILEEPAEAVKVDISGTPREIVDRIRQQLGVENQEAGNSKTTVLTR